MQAKPMRFGRNVSLSLKISIAPNARAMLRIVLIAFIVLLILKIDDDAPQLLGCEVVFCGKVAQHLVVGGEGLSLA